MVSPFPLRHHLQRDISLVHQIMGHPNRRKPTRTEFMLNQISLMDHFSDEGGIEGPWGFLRVVLVPWLMTSSRSSSSSSLLTKSPKSAAVCLSSVSWDVVVMAMYLRVYQGLDVGGRTRLTGVTCQVTWIVTSLLYSLPSQAMVINGQDDMQYSPNIYSIAAPSLPSDDRLHPRPRPQQSDQPDKRQPIYVMYNGRQHQLSLPFVLSQELIQPIPEERTGTGTCRDT